MLINLILVSIILLYDIVTYFENINAYKSVKLFSIL